MVFKSLFILNCLFLFSRKTPCDTHLWSLFPYRHVGFQKRHIRRGVLLSVCAFPYQLTEVSQSIRRLLLRKLWCSLVLQPWRDFRLHYVKLANRSFLIWNGSRHANDPSRGTEAGQDFRNTKVQFSSILCWYSLLSLKSKCYLKVFSTLKDIQFWWGNTAPVAPIERWMNEYIK